MGAIKRCALQKGRDLRFLPNTSLWRAAFKTGITPSRIARQFGISQSNVRKALASDESKK